MADRNGLNLKVREPNPTAAEAKRITLGPKARERDLTQQDIENIITRNEAQAPFLNLLEKIAFEQIAISRNLSVIKLFLATLATDEDQKDILRLAQQLQVEEDFEAALKDLDQLRGVAEQTRTLLEPTPVVARAAEHETPENSKLGERQHER